MEHEDPAKRVRIAIAKLRAVAALNDLSCAVGESYQDVPQGMRRYRNVRSIWREADKIADALEVCQDANDGEFLEALAGYAEEHVAGEFMPLGWTYAKIGATYLFGKEEAHD